MVMNRDYLAISDEKLVDLLTVVHDTVEKNLVAWGIQAFELTEWEPELAAFTAAVNKLKEPENRSPVNTRIKNDARSALEAKARNFIQGRLYHNSKITPADLLSVGLPVHDTHPTHHPAPKSWVALSGRPTNNRQHTVSALDQKTGTKTKPDDAYGVKYAYEIRETAPESPEDLRHSLFSRKTTHVFDYDEKEKGKKAFYAARYENAKGEGGPWSEIVELIIP